MTHGSESEQDWILRAQTGDQAAFQRLAEAHVAPLCRCALAMSGDRHVAEDLAQETLFEAWRSLAKFDGRCRFSTWLYGILRHRFLKHVRRPANRDVNRDVNRDSSREWDDVAAHIVGADSGPVSRLQQAEDSDRLRQALDLLPDEHRQVIELRFFADARLEEIADLLDVPLGTVKSRLHNGLEKLRNQNLSVNLFPSAGESPARQR